MVFLQFSSLWAMAYTTSFMLMLSMTNFLGFWLILEMNLVLFLGVIYFSSSARTFKGAASMKYFIIQSVGSGLIFIGAMMTHSTMFSLWSDVPLLLLGGSLLKLGVAPFHDWFLAVSSEVNWQGFLLLATAQKLGPFLFLSGLAWHAGATSVAMLSTAMSMALSLGVSDMRSVLSVSSIFNSGWFLVLLSKLHQFLLLFITYSLVLYLVMFGFSETGAWSFCQMKKQDTWTSVLVSISLLSLGGVPPLVGSYLKLVTVGVILGSSSTGTLGVFLVGSVWWIYVYLSGAMLLMTGGSALRANETSFSSMKLSAALFNILIPAGVSI